MICDLNSHLKDATDAPSQMVCPITHELMLDPVRIHIISSAKIQVTMVDGYSYERVAAAHWLARKNVSPVTGQPLAHTEVIPNLRFSCCALSCLQRRLRNLIDEYREKHGGGNRIHSGTDAQSATI